MSDVLRPLQVVLCRLHGQSFWLAEVIESETTGELAIRKARLHAQQQFDTGKYEEVRHVSAAVESRWGPLDPGGLFNHGEHPHHVAKGAMEDDTNGK